MSSPLNYSDGDARNLRPAARYWSIPIDLRRRVCCVRLIVSKNATTFHSSQQMNGLRCIVGVAQAKFSSNGCAGARTGSFLNPYRYCWKFFCIQVLIFIVLLLVFKFTRPQNRNNQPCLVFPCESHPIDSRTPVKYLWCDSTVRSKTCTSDFHLHEIRKILYLPTWASSIAIILHILAR